MKKEYTGRGFQYIKFEDRYGQKCSLQESSLATEHAIWFGVDNTGPHITDNNGKVNSPISARMHLTREQVKEILPHLKRFVKKGEIFKR
jgi:hypothetical protein